jgi:membrane protease YdiL (CAAX protease family)
LNNFLVVSKFVLETLHFGLVLFKSKSIDGPTILCTLYFISLTVTVEGFLFIGYFFKKTIKTSRLVLANTVFYILFMLIHVLDEYVISNKGMVVLFIITILVGYLLFATALLRSKTLFPPIGLPLGNNWLHGI